MRRLTSRIAIASLSEGYLDRFHKCGLRTLRPQRRDRDNHGRLAGLRNVRQADLNRESPGPGVEPHHRRRGALRGNILDGLPALDLGVG